MFFKKRASSNTNTGFVKSGPNSSPKIKEHEERPMSIDQGKNDK